MMLPPRIFAVLACALLSTSRPTLAQTRLVDMVPNLRSGETNQDAEPTIAVDPRSHVRLAGSAFTWDNLTQAPNVTATAPIYVSLDRGNTWQLSFIVPTRLGAGFPTGDITLNFSSTLSGAPLHATSWLYAGILSTANAATLPMVVLRAQDPFDLTTVMTSIDSRPGNVDQPHTTAKTAAATDKVYVGFNNGFNCLAPSGRSSTVDVSQDGKVGTPTFGLDVIDARTAPCQDWFAQVVAAHADGTVYAAFVHDLTGTPRLVVVRDDNWALGANPFTALQDPSDLLAGRLVTTGIAWPGGTIGQNRLGASNVSIAVDPGNSDRVYVAWGDGNGANSQTIHVRRSIDRGVNWSTDLVTLNDAVNPEVAINSFGVVGLLYQRVTGGKWETRFARTNDLDATTFNTPGLLLASQTTTIPLSSILGVYIGDYASLVAAGREFFGMFSASNFPDKANFMNGIKYQREVDWVNHKLYADAAHTVLVAASIDPFFFYTTTSICDFWRVFCGICELRWNCFAIYDPWWWLKCPMCGITILVNPGDPFIRVTVFDSRGKRVGALKRLRQPVVEKGITYTHAISLKPTEAVGYVLRAEPTPRMKSVDFEPAYVVKVEGKSSQNSP